MNKQKIGLIIPNLQSGGAERVLSLTSIYYQMQGIVFIFYFMIQIM